ncbi:L-ascorbate metabolism protein UlaG (beta-lactamase superfamily) [Tenacibaculum gallaicum]|uniref:L-ascorbate metabolism protein UlaG (Beta-lactamase superfamily) n=1 Tax=Tenacibaculum gallaicum TaxID=561505 RepID=A0A3E0I1M7_9FLAO|nr:MBL fold metallo-hydrolase [Tenacibaculum gallaicum]REH52416.1 L-ascorbate metabolism protein UlaG (beta-lactamase superfamily) [Tenacibaculum gallaicum]
MRKFNQLLILVLTIISACKTTNNAIKETVTKMQYIRQATVLLEVNSKKILIDPVLSDKGTQDPIPFSNDKRIPMNDLPILKEKIIEQSDAVLITHYHPDHFDADAEKLLPKDILIFCQPFDVEKLKSKGFTNLQSIEQVVNWSGISIKRYEAHHHEGATGAMPFGESSSFSLTFKEKTIFITGDAVLDGLLKNALKIEKPTHVVANTGECTFSKPNPVLEPGKHMTLTKEELLSIAVENTKAILIAIHMDAINHCGLTKEELRLFLKEQEKSIQDKMLIPNEGEVLQL